MKISARIPGNIEEICLSEKESLFENTLKPTERLEQVVSTTEKTDSMHKRGLLVIDDEKDICEAVCIHAAKIGFEATYSLEGKNIKSLCSENIDVVVLDLFVPEIDGVEIIRILAEIDCNAGIILMTGKDANVLQSAMLLAQSRGLNIIGTLNKPFQREELQSLLNKTNATSKTPCNKTKRNLLTVEELHQAIANREVFPYYQPKVKIDTGKPVGFEALARWQHPTKGMISPGEFIPLFEQYGLITDLTTLILDQTFKQSCTWAEAGLQPNIAVNMSILVLNNLDIPDQLLKQARDHNLDPSTITIEVTESAMSNELINSLDILTRIRMKGFLLSIDDFGTGYSSMAQLNRTPFNELKVDKSFVKDIDTNEEKRAICESSIDLAHKLDIKVTAEGIETKAVWDLLKEFYCTEGQGYYFGKPMPADEFKTWYMKRILE